MSHANVANRLPFPIPQLLLQTGVPASGYKYKFYASGASTTPQSAYTGYDGSTLSGPVTSVTLNAYGLPDVNLYLDPDLNYRLVVTDSADTPVFTYDNVRDYARQAVAHFQLYAGNPNGNLAGTAGVVGGSPADAIFDTTNGIIWICTTTGTAATAVWTNTSASLSGSVTMTGVLSPASFSIQQDDYNPTDLATASSIRLNPGADSDITGLAGGASGRQMTLINISSDFRVVLRNQNASSTAANRFLLSNGLDVAILPNYVCVLQYDSLTGRWRLKSPPFALDLGNAQYISNAAFSFSVGSNALTIALKTERGNDPSAGDPVVVAMRNSTVASPDYTLRTVTAALSLVVSAGSALGFANSETNLLHIGFIDNSGTLELAISKDGAIWAEDRQISTTAEGGAGGADSGTTLYSTTTRANVTCRLACVALIQTGATAGNWTAVPTRSTLVNFNPIRPFKNTLQAWCNAAGAGTSINDSFNVSSITDNGTGDLTVTYAVAMADANYLAQHTLKANGAFGAQVFTTGGAATGSVRVQSINTTTGGAVDPTLHYVGCAGA